ncbi:ArsB/NhaD family transporter [Anaerobacillus sp. 1_MG-2023]|uniref:ArsB/NhaD family transporter n=1 Tax=Bacillales TaxID=1385 RepID=UPI0027B89040|nr:ArsB/NhaD family transporter [Anaerobacillus sp. 1_MG-2023]
MKSNSSSYDVRNGTGKGQHGLEMIIALIIFVLAYVGILTEKINRAIVACGGGLLMLLSGITTTDSAFMNHVDWNTIALLFSMMILVSITSQNGLFEYIAIKLAQKVQGKPLPLLAVIGTLTAIGSALLDNVTTVLLLVPITLTLTRILKITSMPFLVTVILSSNIGGTATLIGDPPNIMIGQAVDHLDFNDFLYNLAPVVVVIYAVIMTGLLFLYRKGLTVDDDHRQTLLRINADDYLKRGPLLYKSSIVLLMTISGFLLHPILHTELTNIAMAGAVLLLLITQNEHKIEEVFESIEWVTLFFFIGLFILIGGLEEVGIIDEVARSILLYTDGDLPKTSLVILWGSGFLSAFLDNIPFVAAMIPVITEFSGYGMTNLDPLWWSLALGSCLGGNGTLIGASANVVVAGLALKDKQEVRFIEFLKIGIPVVCVSLAISTIYMYFRYLLPYY